MTQTRTRRIETLIQAVAAAEQTGNEQMARIARRNLYRELDR